MSTALTTIELLKSRIGEEELLQIAGLGSFHSAQGRELDEARLEREIGFASSLVIGYLKKRYPFVGELQPGEVPEVLAGYVDDIVRYRLRARSDNANAVTEEVRKRYEDAIKWLKDAEAGRANLEFEGRADDDGLQINATGKVMASNPPARAHDVLEGW